MPDITYPSSQADAAVPDSSKVRESLFIPQSTPSTLAVLNGMLTKTNIDAAQLPLTYREARRGAFGGGAMEGATANQDFFSNWFQATDTPKTDIDEVGVGVAGVAMEYVLPYHCTVVYVRWQVGVITNGGDGWHPGTTAPSTPAKAALLKLFVDGYPVDTYEQSINQGRYVVPDRLAVKWNYYSSVYSPDSRWWSCEAAFYSGDIHSDNLAVGVRRPYQPGPHSVELRLAHDVDIARVKTRCMAVSYRR